MIENILNNIKDQSDYLTALIMFRDSAPLTEEEVEKLIPLYQEYGQDPAHPELAKLYMALDLMPGRSRKDSAYFVPLGLPKADLDALFLSMETVDLLRAEETPTTDKIDNVVEITINGSAVKPALY